MRSMKLKFSKMFNWIMKTTIIWSLNVASAILKAIELSASLTIYLFLNFSKFKTVKTFYAKIFMIKIMIWCELETDTVKGLLNFNSRPFRNRVAAQTCFESFLNRAWTYRLREPLTTRDSRKEFFRNDNVRWKKSESKCFIAYFVNFKTFETKIL